MNIATMKTEIYYVMHCYINCLNCVQYTQIISSTQLNIKYSTLLLILNYFFLYSIYFFKKLQTQSTYLMPYPGYCMVWLLCLFKYAIIYSCCCFNLSNFAVFCKKIFYLPYIPSSLVLNKRHLSFSAMLPYPPKPSIFPRV